MFEQLESLREVYGTATLVVWSAAILGFAFGIIAEMSKYCARAALAEWLPQSEPAVAAQTGRPRTVQYLAALITALAGTQVLFFTSNMDLSQTIYWSVPVRPLALVLGGLLFGVGMVLAGGCVSRLLVLAASGNARSMVTLLFTGVAGYATLRGLLSYPRIWLEDAWQSGVSPATVYEASVYGHLSAICVSAALAIALLALVARRFGLRGVVSGAFVGLCVVAGWVVTGIIGLDEFEPTTLASLSFVAPAGEALQYLMIFTGDTIRFSVALLLGVLCGAFVSAIVGRRVRFQGFRNETSVMRYIVGGTLMGFGGVTALGCSVGQALSGASTASFASIGALLAIAVGGYSTMWLQARKRLASQADVSLQPAE